MNKQIYSLVFTGSLALASVAPAGSLLAAPHKHRTTQKNNASRKHKTAPKPQTPSYKDLAACAKLRNTFTMTANLPPGTSIATITDNQETYRETKSTKKSFLTLLFSDYFLVGATGFCLISDSISLACWALSDKKPAIKTPSAFSALKKGYAYLTSASNIAIAAAMAYELYNKPRVPDAAKNISLPSRNKIHIADQFPGTLLMELNGIPQLPGFYHIWSGTPVRLELGENYCVIHALYNMVLIDERILGKQISDAEFFETHRVMVENLGLEYFLPGRGTSPFQAAKIAQRLKLSQFVALDACDNGIEEVSSFAILNATRIDRAYAEVFKIAQEWHQTTGPRVAHFLCCIPGHGFGISVVRLADGSQAMYLYDCQNEMSIDRDLMSKHIEYIYNRFF